MTWRGTTMIGCICWLVRVKVYLQFVEKSMRSTIEIVNESLIWNHQHYIVIRMTIIVKVKKNNWEITVDLQL